MQCLLYLNLYIMKMSSKEILHDIGPYVTIFIILCIFTIRETMKENHKRSESYDVLYSVPVTKIANLNTKENHKQSESYDVLYSVPVTKIANLKLGKVAVKGKLIAGSENLLSPITMHVVQFLMLFLSPVIFSQVADKNKEF